MKLFIAFSRAYPTRSAMVVGSLFLASLFEAMGLTTLLPLLARVGDEATRRPTALSRFVESALGTIGLTPSVGVILAIVVITVSLKCVLMMFANKQVGYTVAHVATDLRLSFIRSLLSARWEYYLRQPVGALANSLSNEAGAAASAYLSAATLISLVAQTIVYSVIAMFISWQATLVALTAGTVCVYLLNRFVRVSRRAATKERRLLRSLLVQLADSMQSLKPLKAMARENLANAMLQADTKRLNRAAQRDLVARESLRALQEPMLTILAATGLYVALVEFQMSFASVMLLAFLLMRVLMFLGRVQREYQDMVASAGAYWSMVAEIEEAQKESENPPAGAAPLLQSAIRFENVSFQYNDRWILRNVTLTIPAGGITALAGASGAGKTTMVDLITVLLRPQEGDIWIDDLPLQRVDWRAWRRKIGYVPQDTILLHDTVAHNVTLGDPELTEADAKEALRAAGIWDFVADLPEGLKTIVGERGGKLSGGQRQRIAIARALAHKPRLLILDEATNALDAETEAAICRTLEALRGELTIITISHQSPLVDVADRVYRVGDGAVALVADRPLQAASG